MLLAQAPKRWLYPVSMADKYLGIENFTEARRHSELSEESQSPAKV